MMQDKEMMKFLVVFKNETKKKFISFLEQVKHYKGDSKGVILKMYGDRFQIIYYHLEASKEADLLTPNGYIEYESFIVPYFVYTYYLIWALSEDKNTCNYYEFGGRQIGDEMEKSVEFRMTSQDFDTLIDRVVKEGKAFQFLYMKAKTIEDKLTKKKDNVLSVQLEMEKKMMRKWDNIKMKAQRKRSKTCSPLDDGNQQILYNVSLENYSKLAALVEKFVKMTMKFEKNIDDVFIVIRPSIINLNGGDYLRIRFFFNIKHFCDYNFGCDSFCFNRDLVTVDSDVNYKLSLEQFSLLFRSIPSLTAGITYQFFIHFMTDQIVFETSTKTQLGKEGNGDMMYKCIMRVMAGVTSFQEVEETLEHNLFGFN